MTDRRLSPPELEVSESRKRLEQTWERMGFGSNPPSCLDAEADSLVATLEELYAATQEESA